jgi:hypothetical protein
MAGPIISVNIDELEIDLQSNFVNSPFAAWTGRLTGRAGLQRKSREAGLTGGVIASSRSAVRLVTPS